MAQNLILPSAESLYVFVIFDPAKGVIGHSQFFTLVDERRSFLGEHHRSQCLGRCDSKLGRVVAKVRDGAGIIVIANEYRVPAMFVRRVVKLRVQSLELRQSPGGDAPTIAIDPDYIKMKDHV